LEDEALKTLATTTSGRALLKSIETLENVGQRNDIIGPPDKIGTL